MNSCHFLSPSRQRDYLRNEQPWLKATPEFSEEIWLRVQIMRFLRQALLTITPHTKKGKGKGKRGEKESQKERMPGSLHLTNENLRNSASV